MVSPLSMLSGLCWCNVANIWGHKTSYKVTNRFTCASTTLSITSRAVTNGGGGRFFPDCFHSKRKEIEPKERPNRTGHTAELMVCASVHIAAMHAWPVKKLFMGETGRKLSGRFREHLRDVGRNDNDASKPLAHQFKFASYSSPGTREADFENTLVSREMKKKCLCKV